MGIRITARNVEILCPFPHTSIVGGSDHIDDDVPIVISSHGYGMLSVQDLADMVYRLWYAERELRAKLAGLQAIVNELGEGQ